MENKLTASELRIGNLVLGASRGLVTIVDIGIIDHLEKYKSGYVPIPLTEEWLLKFGAEVYDFDNGEPNQYRIGNRLFVIRDNKIVDYGSSVILEYVHRFQNFMYEVTNEELTIK
jgi:hypothetical protein